MMLTIAVPGWLDVVDSQHLVPCVVEREVGDHMLRQTEAGDDGQVDVHYNPTHEE
jgi:hypothetical protein